MNNAYWYIILCVASTFLFIYALYKNKDNKLIVLYFVIAGFTYFMEYFVLVLFKGYVYYPKILKNQYFDNIMGAVVSDGFTIPMISTFIAAFRLNFMKRLFISLFILLIEILFLKIKIYEHYWWSNYYTFFGSVIVFYYAQRWLSIIHKPIKHIIRFINLFFINLAIQASIVFILAGILKLYFYEISWFKDPVRSHVAFSTIYIIFISIIFVSLVTFQLGWISRTIAILLTSICDIILLNMDILHLSNKWSLINFLVFRIIILTILSLINKYWLPKTYLSIDYKEY